MWSSSRDNWQRLVEAVMKREQYLELAHKPYSRSPSISTLGYDSDCSEQILNMESIAPSPHQVPLENRPPKAQVAGNKKASSGWTARKLISSLYNRRNGKDNSFADIPDAIAVLLRRHQIEDPTQKWINVGTIGKTRLFHAKELKKATDNFNESRILGQGGQGTVYKGMLSNGMIVAVKKMKLVDEYHLEQFIKEVVVLSQINHRNVVRLLGCCLKTKVPLLVFEFLPNGTLFDRIHNANTEFPISWSTRLKIAADVAVALAYLHSATSTPIYHRDVKTTNILLDENYAVKVSDFGISGNFEISSSDSVDCMTTRVQGTLGYLDPEYFHTNQFTEKSDVYSFGVVLAELLTGQKAITVERGEGMCTLAAYFCATIDNNKLDEILDPQVLEQDDNEEVNKVALLARRCLSLEGRIRPSMKEVALQLEILRLPQMPTTVAHEYEKAYESSNMTRSDMVHTWTATDISEILSSSSHTHTHSLEFQSM